MTKSSYFFALVLTLLYVTVAVAQHPVLDAVANKVVAEVPVVHLRAVDACRKPRKSRHQQGEQKAMEMLKTDPQMRHEFVEHCCRSGRRQTDPMRHDPMIVRGGDLDPADRRKRQKRLTRSAPG